MTLFDPTPTDDEVAAALSRAGLGSLVDGGIHRELGAGGAGLSAGEAQLLALARVWLRDPDLVVLDEATARVDPVTEAALEAAIAELIHGRTTLVIAHRLSTLRHVDEIVVLDHGRVVEHGDREALVADADSRFHRLLALALDTDVARTRRRPGGHGVNVWQLAWRAAQHRPRTFWLGWTLFVMFFTFPVAIGWLLGTGFDALSDGRTGRVYVIAACIAVLEVARMTTIHFGALVWTQAWVHIQTLLRANMLAAQMASGGPEAGQPVGSAGEAITHFRDDAEDVAMFVDGILDVSAGLVFTVGAVVRARQHRCAGRRRAADPVGRRRARDAHPRLARSRRSDRPTAPRPQPSAAWSVTSWPRRRR